MRVGIISLLTVLGLVLGAAQYDYAVTKQRAAPRTAGKTSPDIQLLHEAIFTKTVSKGGECSYPGIPCQKNILLYTINQTPDGSQDELWVNTLANVKRFGTSEHRQAVKDFNLFLQKPASALHTAQSLQEQLRLFDDGLEYESQYIGPIDIAYPGVDRFKAVYTMDGQDFPGGLMVRIMAQKGQTMLMLDGIIPETTAGLIQDERIKHCYPKDVWPNTWKLSTEAEKAVEKCYFEDLKADPKIQKAVHEKAESLIKQFALK